MICAGFSAIIVRALVVCALALPTAAAAATILVLGDSLSSGYGMPREQGWVGLLAQRLRVEKLDYKVANASISGETTLGGRNRIPAALKTHRPAIVIVQLGGNDGLRGGSLASIRGNLEAIVDACRRANAQVLLVGIRVPPNYGTPYAETFHGVFGEVARSKNAALVPFIMEGFSDKPEMFLPDGIHPAAVAQPLMLDTVWRGLRPLLKKPGDREIGKS